MTKGNYVLCADDARFFNHSSEPNCADFDFHSLEDCAYTIATRDIATREELTVNYAVFDANFKGF